MSPTSIGDWLASCGIAGLLIVLLSLLLLPYGLMRAVTGRRGRAQTGLLLPVALMLAPILVGLGGYWMGMARIQSVLNSSPGQAHPAELEAGKEQARRPLWLGVGTSLFLLSTLALGPLMGGGDEEL